MSITPSGWYPDPGQQAGAPAIERWWDGTTWTEYTRSAPPQAQGQAQGQVQGQGQGQGQGLGPGQGPMGYPQSGYPPAQPGGGNRRPAVIAVAVAGALVVAAVAGGFVLLNQDDEGSDRADPAVSASASASASVPGPGTGGGTETPEAPPTPQAPEAPGGPAVDANFGISVPVPDGWQKQDTGSEGNAYISTDPYECAESSTGSCVAAGVYTGPGSGSDPKAAAQKDIEANAKDSYGEVKSHQEAKAGKVTVAGKPGYLIRWKLDVAEGTDGYVQSVAFKSPVNGRMTVVRFGFDDKDGAPELSVMDEILKGIRAVGSPNGV